MNKSTNQNNRRGFLSKMLVAGASSIALFSSSAFAKGGKVSSRDTTDTLTQAQKDRLFFIYQEEKVARDVYTYLSNMYEDESTFASIKLAEQRHMDSAQKLCEKYGVNIRKVDEDVYGEFFVPYLNDLYKECIDLGEEGLKEALNVGILIEETDIGTLTDTIKALDVKKMPADVISAYETLREGSYNHLESFEARVARV